MFTYPFRYCPSAEVAEASRRLIEHIASNPCLHELFAPGKMMGVLVCDEGVLYGFSGLAGGLANVDGFVPPIYDYTPQDGYFRQREAYISELVAGQVSGGCDGASGEGEVGPVEGGIGGCEGGIGGYDGASGEGEKREKDPSVLSKELQDWLFSQYEVMNGKGEVLSIREIFALRGLVPAGGTGECAAPKLLNHAFRQGMHPRSMGEFWYGASHGSQVRQQGRFYPSCTGKCGPLLTWMMQGLDVEPNPLDAPYIYDEPRVLYSDEAIVVAFKPSGMLSVPGKTAAPCMTAWLGTMFGEIHSCHRLDQDTSGVMVFARNVQAKVALEGQFASRQVSKTYRARLDASPTPFHHARCGTIALPLMLDYYHRPCQMVDYQNGKMAVTKYEVLEIFPDGEVDIRFYPQTGRTHQLRVHAASAAGLGRPIKGDHLYGSPDGGRLYLQAESLLFIHPTTGRRVSFTCEGIGESCWEK